MEAMVVAEKEKEAGEEALAVEVVVAAGVAAAAAAAACLGLPHELALPLSDGPRFAHGTPVEALVR